MRPLLVCVIDDLCGISPLSEITDVDVRNVNFVLVEDCIVLQRNDIDLFVYFVVMVLIIPEPNCIFFLKRSLSL